jgi:chromate transporter
MKGTLRQRPQEASSGSVREVGAAFLKLGLSSFGGPIAHFGYFRREFVQRRRWLDDAHFAQLMALCQFLPGPASSQLGFSLGLLRAGWAGAVTAFVAFTLPSALLMFAFAAYSHHLGGMEGQAALHGLKLVAVAVVAQGVLGMVRTLTPDPRRALIAALAAGLVLVHASPLMQILVVAMGAVLGPLLCRQIVAKPGEAFSLRYGRGAGAALLLTYAVLLLAALCATHRWDGRIQVAAAFYRAGALVFGGGHVVLPLLKQTVVAPGWIDNDTFLAGYGAAQAVPGPMFSVSAFLGDRLLGGYGGAQAAVICLLSIFLPGFLLVAGMLPFWRALSTRNAAARLLAGVNAAVVGLLIAALYDPLWLNAVHGAQDVAIALIAFVLLVYTRKSALVAVAWCVAASLLRAVFP